jgi:hypothetical protein
VLSVSRPSDSRAVGFEMVVPQDERNVRLRRAPNLHDVLSGPPISPPERAPGARLNARMHTPVEAFESRVICSRRFVSGVRLPDTAARIPPKASALIPQDQPNLSAAESDQATGGSRFHQPSVAVAPRFMECRRDVRGGDLRACAACRVVRRQESASADQGAWAVARDPTKGA